MENVCIHEFHEETKLKVPEPVLPGSIIIKQVFDYLLQSPNSRTIIYAFFIKLVDCKLSKIKDIDNARWNPLNELL